MLLWRSMWRLEEGTQFLLMPYLGVFPLSVIGLLSFLVLMLPIHTLARILVHPLQLYDSLTTFFFLLPLFLTHGDSYLSNFVVTDCWKSKQVVASQDWPEVTKYAGLVSAQAHRQELIQDLFKTWQDPARGTMTGGMIKYAIMFPSIFLFHIFVDLLVYYFCNCACLLFISMTGSCLYHFVEQLDRNLRGLFSTGSGYCFILMIIFIRLVFSFSFLTRVMSLQGWCQWRAILSSIALWAWCDSEG